jgi:hypothetical protein
MKVGGVGGPDYEGGVSKVGGTDPKAAQQLAQFSKFDLTNEIVGRLSKMPNKSPEVDSLINNLTKITHGIGNACW